MSKRDHFSDPADEDGPPSKTRKGGGDDDDGSGSGRIGRVRKKSAKVLEMEEFEQAEKTSTSTKKSKTPKGTPTLGTDGDQSEGLVVSAKKSKLVNLTSFEATPTSVPKKSKKSAVPAELSLRLPTNSVPVAATPMETLSQVAAMQDMKPIVPIPAMMAPIQQPMTTIKQEDPQSVIKHLLSSPLAGSGGVVTTSATIQTPTTKKSSKKIKFEDGMTAPTPKSSKKEKSKMKIEIMSPSEIGRPVSTTPAPPAEPKAPALKMKIVSGTNPLTAQVSSIGDSAGSSDTQTPGKGKKSSKKEKTPTPEVKKEKKVKAETPREGESSVKKKKVSKKKEKLIQDAINAAQQVPNMIGMGAASPPLGSPPPVPSHKSSKKKEKISSTVAKQEAGLNDSLVMDFDDGPLEDDGEESTLVIAETEKKKKKKEKKTKSPKDPKDPEAKKVPKRAPTAYMLFCNAHRPDIVAENPGIEFAGISRKLGELWQTQSTKQKLQWRKKAQRRMKKSNLIFTGKNGKESTQGGAAASASTAQATSSTSGQTTNQRLALMLQRNKPSAVVDEGPLSPTKVGIESGLEHGSDSCTFSIEPLDVAAHLKLLGESLSIIGMRLQEHKGMIAVQGSLSVLLDSLLCACGPLLCLTQQVPGMDGCSPSVHAQTLDSVAYVMPGL